MPPMLVALEVERKMAVEVEQKLAVEQESGQEEVQ